MTQGIDGLYPFKVEMQFTSNEVKELKEWLEKNINGELMIFPNLSEEAKDTWWCCYFQNEEDATLLKLSLGE